MHRQRQAQRLRVEHNSQLKQMKYKKRGETMKTNKTKMHGHVYVREPEHPCQSGGVANAKHNEKIY